jgi:hypothetical protein
LDNDGDLYLHNTLKFENRFCHPSKVEVNLFPVLGAAFSLEYLKKVVKEQTWDRFTENFEKIAVRVWVRASVTK